MIIIVINMLVWFDSIYNITVINTYLRYSLLIDISKIFVNNLLFHSICLLSSFITMLKIIFSLLIILFAINNEENIFIFV